MGETHLPVPKEIRDLFLDLLGREVTLHPEKPYAPTPTEAVTLATYVDDYLRPSARVAADLRFTAYAGAAIGLVPPAGAETAIDEEALNDTINDNFYEVLNIAASLFNGGDADHLKLHSVHPAVKGGMAVSDRILTLTLGRREDLTVDIAGYGSGRVSFIMLR